MEIKSVNNSRQPNYPTIELFIKHPELLSRNIPNSWLKNKFVSTSLAAFLLYGGGTSLVACGETSMVNTIKDSDSDSDTEEETNTDVTHIAPVFAHGEGSGATGCVVMSPPVFLSEDEAIKIILDKLRAEGYNFSTEDCPTLSLDVLPFANVCDVPKETTNIELKMDAYNSNAKWTIQFISTDDYSKFKNDDCWSSVTDYKTKKAAEIINQALKEQQETNAVVFYDPITYMEDWKESQAIEKSKDLLLAQVEDFIKWLKTNNITIQ